VIAVEFAPLRKVRTPQGTKPGKSRDGVTCRQGHRNIPPVRVRVKRWCKRPPAVAAMQQSGNPFWEQGQAGAEILGTAPSLTAM